MKLAIPGMAAVTLVSVLSAQDPAVQTQDATKTTKSPAATVLEHWAPAIVTVRCVLKTSFMGGGASDDSESNAEFHGVVVDSSGLVLTNSSAFEAPDMFHAEEAGGFRMQITPRDFKVVFDKDEKEYPALLVATDKRLGLAFVQIQELGKKKLTVVDFSKEPAIDIGAPVVAVSRLGKGFDNACYYRTTTISGAINKPRTAWILDRTPAAIGHPVFDYQGRALGVLVKISSGIQKDNAGMGGLMGMLSSLTSGGGPDGQVFLLPAKVADRVIGQAKTQAKKRLAEAKKGDKDK